MKYLTMWQGDDREMREILFRAKKTDNGKWIYGYYAVIGERHVIIKEQSEDYYSVDDSVKKSHGNEVVEVNPETVCQYTGLTDKNGRKIFEGDIVQDYPFKAVVKFGEFENQVLKNIGFNLDWIKELSYRQDLPYWANKIEIVGNIFDNPELLEGSGI